jgi:manganese efflux pump family protein
VGLLLVGIAVGMSNFGAAIGVACSGVSRSTRIQIVGCFFLFESGMPLVGLAVGGAWAAMFGATGRWLAGALLVGVGVAAAAQARRDQSPLAGRLSFDRIVIASLVLSIDNLIVGFALGAFGVPVVVAALVIGTISVLMSMVALELGSRLGARAGHDGELLAALILIAVGIAVLAGVI